MHLFTGVSPPPLPSPSRARRKEEAATTRGGVEGARRSWHQPLDLSQLLLPKKVENGLETWTLRAWCSESVISDAYTEATTKGPCALIIITKAQRKSVFTELALMKLPLLLVMNCRQPGLWTNCTDEGSSMVLWFRDCRTVVMQDCSKTTPTLQDQLAPLLPDPSSCPIHCWTRVWRHQTWHPCPQM